MITGSGEEFFSRLPERHGQPPWRGSRKQAIIWSATRYAHIDVGVVTQRRRRDRDRDPVARLKWRNSVPGDGRLRDPGECGYEDDRAEHNTA